MAEQHHGEWIDQQIAKLERKTFIQAPNGCKIWLEGTHGRTVKYGSVKIKLPGHMISKSINVHRLRYMLGARNFNLNPKFDVSHICHKSLCINFDHLSYEPHNINMNRQTCKVTHPPRCLGHGKNKACLI